MKYSFIEELRHQDLPLGVFNVVSELCRGFVNYKGHVSFNKDIIRVSENGQTFIIKHNFKGIKALADINYDKINEYVKVKYEYDYDEDVTKYYIDYYNLNDKSDINKGVYEWVYDAGDSTFKYYDLEAWNEVVRNDNLHEIDCFGDAALIYGIIPDQERELGFSGLRFINETIRNPHDRAQSFSKQKTLKKGSK